jgi:ribonuclease HI
MLRKRTPPATTPRFGIVRERQQPFQQRSDAEDYGPIGSTSTLKPRRTRNDKDRATLGTPPRDAAADESHPVEAVCKCMICFTDGACINNGKRHAKASYAVVWPEHPAMNYAQRLRDGEEHTNNRAEFTAVIHAFEQADEIDPGRNVPMLIYTDSMLLINSLTKWMNAWKMNGWRKADGSPVANRDLLEVMHEHVSVRVVKFRHVRAHTKKKDWESSWNDYADRCAKVALHGATNV